MNMNVKGRKKMKGFMCHSPAATAVCMTAGIPGRSVIVPRRRRPDRTVLLADHAKDISSSNINSPRYGRLVQSPPNLASRSAITTPNNISNRRSPSSPSTVAAAVAVADQSPASTNTDFQDRCRTRSQFQQLPELASSSDDDQVFQVVVMRVSLHCQGCAGKVKKHLSKMEGVTSFSIDLESKRVTVMGHVSPVGVLHSLSKVKKAEFWPP